MTDNMMTIVMKGYDTASGYMGLIDGKYVLFVSEAEYKDYLSDEI